MKEDGFLLGGIIEVDETYVGGTSRRGHPVANLERKELDAEARGIPLRPGLIKGERHPREQVIRSGTVH